MKKIAKTDITLKKVLANKNNIEIRANVKIFLYGFIKVFSININKDGIEFFGNKILYKTFFKPEKMEKLRKKLKNLNFKNLDNVTKKMNIKINSIKFILKIGTEDIFITNFLVVIISSIIANLIRKKISIVDIKNVNYRVLPEFNKNEIYFEGDTVIRVSTKDLRHVLG